MGGEELYSETREVDSVLKHECMGRLGLASERQEGDEKLREGLGRK